MSAALGLEALHLAHPAWIHGLWLGALIALGLALLERRGGEELRRLVAPRLAARLVVRPARWRRRARIALFAASLLSMTVALVRPQWGETFVAAPRVGAEIMIALDVSRSMLADDARPTRLERAKAEIADLLGYLEDDQVGLIAFAGRASILSPLTPDKSFLRLALEGAGPHSVPRGGTSLAEPILRATAGLGEPGPSQRALLLITDGEDHDSFALDAARRAAAAGIKIITIGFGDEAGSPIFVRDPDDGSRTQVRDAEGNPVLSRLNGDLLREIALATDGAYVPAGTGVLDLASIYESHIARLTRGQLEARGRSVRGETYPIFVGLALAALVAGVGLGMGGGRTASAGLRPEEDGSATATSLRVLLVLLAVAFRMGSPLPAQAADQPAEPNSSTSSSTPAAEEDPRSRFNRANERLAAGDPSAASALYREARREATDDVELRYAASYNLGQAAVAQADALEAKRPKEALTFLHEAADWFRDAAAMRPDEDDPRHNLEVTLRRAAILADAIARKEEGGLEERLDRLIDERRARVAEVAGLLEAVAQQEDIAVSEALAAAFDRLATAEREAIADAQSVGDRVADEKAIVETRPEAERTPEDRLRAVSLEGVLAYLDQGVERMGQTRRQLRLRSAERAYRRSAEALALLKRARDQLRDPVEQIGVLLGEIGSVARATDLLARGGESGAPRGPERLPAFLTPEAIAAETAAVEARVGELAERFEHAASASGAAGNPDPAEQAPGEALRAAAPLVLRADSEMKRAVEAMAAPASASAPAPAPARAHAAEIEAMAALAEAQELFFDLRELLAATHETEARIAAVAGAESPEAEVLRTRESAALAEAQARNLARADRLESLLAAEREAARSTVEASETSGSSGPGGADSAPDEARAAIDARHARASALLAEARAAMQQARGALGEPTGTATPARAGAAGRKVAWPRVAETASLAADRLDALRRLFLSLLERLQRLERDQVDLGDRTRDAIALAATESKSGVRGGPTQARVDAAAAEQAALEAEAGTIADALLVQSQSQTESQAEADTERESAATGPDADTLRRAAEHVATAQLSMREANEIFADEAKVLSGAEQVQTVARDELRKAIALLSPPPSEPPNDEQAPPRDDSGQGEQEQDPQQEQKPEEQGSSEEGAGDGEQEDDAAQGDGGDEPASEEDPGRDGEEGAENQPGSETQTGQPGSAAPPGGVLGQAEDAGSREASGAERRDPAQILQGVRDREAARRAANERRARERRRGAGVEKDW